MEDREREYRKLKKEKRAIKKSGGGAAETKKVRKMMHRLREK